MTGSKAGVSGVLSAPPAVSRAAASFLVVGAVHLLVLIIVGVARGGLSLQSTGTIWAFFVSIYLWACLPSGERSVWKHGLLFGGFVAAASIAALVIVSVKVATWDVPRQAIALLANGLFLGPAVTLVAGAAAVLLLLRPESKRFFEPRRPRS